MLEKKTVKNVQNKKKIRAEINEKIQSRRLTKEHLNT